MKSVAWPGLEAGRLERDVLDQQQPGRPDRLDGQRLALGDDEALLVAQPRRGGGRDEEQDQPEVGEQRRHLGVLVAVAVEEARAVRVGRLADAEARSAAGRAWTSSAGTPAIAARSGSRGSKYGSGWATRTSLTPRHSRGVRSSVQTTIDTTSTTSAALNHGERKTENTDSRSMSVDDGRPEDAGRSGRGRVLDRGRVVGRRAEREVGELLDGHPDDRQQGQEDDLDDREVDRREQVPQPVPEAGGDVAAGRSGSGRRGDGRARDGSSP